MLGVGIDLFSRAVASQVFSALMSLTSVFGMGTGEPQRHKHRLFTFSRVKAVGDPWENRTPVSGVRGLRLSRLTNGPYMESA